MKKFKRISAIIGLILIISMYIISFIAAVFFTDIAPGLFYASVFCTIAIPIMIFGLIETYKYVHRNDKDTTKDSTSEEE